MHILMIYLVARL